MYNLRTCEVDVVHVDWADRALHTSKQQDYKAVLLETVERSTGESMQLCAGHKLALIMQHAAWLPTFR